MELVKQSDEENVGIRQPTNHRVTILSDSSATGLLDRSNPDPPPFTSSREHLWEKRWRIILVSIISLSILSGIVVMVYWYAHTTGVMEDLNIKDDGLKTGLGSSLLLSGNFKDGNKKKLEIITSTSKYGKKLVKMLGLNSSHTPSYIILSPLMLIPPDTCEVSLTQSTTDHLFIIPKQFNFSIRSSKASGKEIRFLNATFFRENTDGFRVASETNQKSFGSLLVSFRPCIIYTQVRDNSKQHGQLAVNIRQVEHHQFDRCSLEYFHNSTVDCDWWKLTTNEEANDNIGEFEWVQNFFCLETGVKSNPSGYPRFLRFSADLEKKENISNAYLLSPRFTTEFSNEFTFSLHYAIICDDLELTAYVVDSNSNFLSAASTSIPFLNLTKARHFWIYDRKTVTIPQEYNNFHILIKATVRKRLSCGRTKICFRDPLNPQPTIAIDEISLEIRYPNCSVTTSNQTNDSFMDTNFDDSKYNNWTYNPNGWKIKKLSNLTSGYCDLIRSLAKISRGNSDNYILVLNFDDSNVTGNTFFRSPLLLANNNCSCTMKFQYTIIKESHDRQISPLHVLQKFGVDDASQTENQKTLWYQVRPTKGEWRYVEIDIKLVNNRVPFLIEFNDLIGYKGIDGSSCTQIFIDDISFHGCDFSYYR